jgi:hypothetical protein
MDFAARTGPGGSIISSASRTGSGDMGQSVYPTKALVLSVYYPEEDDRSFAANGGQSCITCDVRTIGLKPRYLHRVPIYQRTHGLWDEDLFVPRAATQNIEGGALATEQASSGKEFTSVTPAESTDASVVLLGFLDGSPAQPFIYPVEIPHRHAKNLPAKANGRVRRIRHSGVLMEWDKDGNWTLDASGAAKQSLGTKGVEVSNSGTAGIVTIKTNDGTDESSIVLDKDSSIKILDGAGNYLELDGSSDAVLEAVNQVALKATTVVADASSVLLGGALAVQPVIKGTMFQTAETTLYAFLTAYMGAAATAWGLIAQQGAPSKMDAASPAASAASAWAGGLAAWAIQATAAQSGVTKTL